MDYREVLARGAGGGELLQTALLHQGGFVDYRELLARGAGGGDLLQTALLHQQDQIWRCQTLCLEQYLLKYFLVLHNNKILFFTASKCLTATISANTDNTADMPVRGAPHFIPVTRVSDVLWTCGGLI